jgi:hypothetical protein
LWHEERKKTSFSLTIFFKFRFIVFKEWRIPMLAAGNELPYDQDKAASISRRLVVLYHRFRPKVVNTNLLKELIHNELPAILFKVSRDRFAVSSDFCLLQTMHIGYRPNSQGNELYRRIALNPKFNGVGIYSMLPPYFTRTQNMIDLAVSAHASYLHERLDKTNNPQDRIPWDDVVSDFAQWYEKSSFCPKGKKTPGFFFRFFCRWPWWF